MSLIIELSGQNIFFGNDADLFGVSANFSDHGGGVRVDALGLKQDEIAELQLPDNARTREQSNHGSQFFKREGLAGQSHFELLLQLSHPQQRLAFILELDDLFFEKLEDARRCGPRNVVPRDIADDRLAQRRDSRLPSVRWFRDNR